MACTREPASKASINRTPVRNPRPDPELLPRIDKLRKMLKEIHISVKNREFLIEKRSAIINTRSKKKWKELALSQEEVYSDLCKQMKFTGHNPSKHQVEQWERKAERLHKATLNFMDKVEEKDMWGDWAEDPNSDFKDGWSWEEATGKSLDTEELVDPKDSSRPNIAGTYSSMSIGLSRQMGGHHTKLTK